MPTTHVVSKPKKEKMKNEVEDDSFDRDFTKKHGKLRDNRLRKSRNED